MPTSLNLVKGIGPATAEKLAAADLKTAEDLATTTPEQLANVPGFGKLRAKQVIANARQLVTEGVPDPIQSGDTKPVAGKKNAAKNKKPKKSKKSQSKKKAGKKKGKPDKLKKEKGKTDKGKKGKGKKGKDKKTGSKRKAKKKKK